MAKKLIIACKELNIGLAAAVDFCESHGCVVPLNPNAHISEDMYLQMCAYFRPLESAEEKGIERVESIGFSNFRRFEEFAPLALSGVTYFVGGNNAGKSTVVKATLLTLYNLRHLQFENSGGMSAFEVPFRFEGEGLYDVRIGDFGTALNANVRKDAGRRNEISFSIRLDHLRFTIGVIDSATTEGKTLTSSGDTYAIVSRVAIDNMRDNASVSADFLAKKVKFVGKNTLDEEQRQQKERIQETSKQIEEQIEALGKQIEEQPGDANAHATLYAQKTELESRLRQNRQRLKELPDAKPFSESSDMSFLVSKYLHTHPIVGVMQEMADLLRRKAKDKGGDKAKYAPQYRYLKTMADEAKAILSSIRMEYIPAHIAKQRTFFQPTDNDYMSFVISEYAHSRIQKGDKEYLFLQRWLDEASGTGEAGLGICTDFTIRSIAGEAYQVDVETPSGNRCRLADLGMGAIQMFILLLRFATLMHRYTGGGSKPIVFVEEPELNLHPNWQSHLAEIFRDMNSWGFQVVVETHSEYLIRKSQVLVADMGYETQALIDEECPMKVYDFYGDKYKDMRYRPSGRFMECFGTGFFDESAKSTTMISAKEMTEQPKQSIRWRR